MENLHDIPRFKDSLGYLYVEHARVDRSEKSIAIHTVEGITPAPAAALSLLMIGPGVSITHAAITTLADNNCPVVWCGEQGIRAYAFGLPGSRSSYGLLRQAKLASDEHTRLEIVRRMYQMRFGGEQADGLTIEQLRGLEGVRVRSAYAKLSRETGVEWTGRAYDRTSWSAADPVNRALSCANACLYGICYAAILACGYSPAIGFIHTGRHASFVFDVADLYKVDIAVPVAFEVARDLPPNIEREVRLRCREYFASHKLLRRIIPDIQKLLDLGDSSPNEDYIEFDEPDYGSDLWSPSATQGGEEAA